MWWYSEYSQGVNEGQTDSIEHMNKSFSCSYTNKIVDKEIIKAPKLYEQRAAHTSCIGLQERKQGSGWG